MASILLVEDSDMMIDLFTTRLKSLKHKVEAVERGQAALDRLEESQFDIVISDLHMPDMSGVELIIAMVKKGIKTPVILVSGDFEEKDTERYPLIVGCNVAIIKGDFYETIKGVIDEILAGRDQKDSQRS